MNIRWWDVLFNTARYKKFVEDLGKDHRVSARRLELFEEQRIANVKLQARLSMLYGQVVDLTEQCELLRREREPSNKQEAVIARAKSRQAGARAEEIRRRVIEHGGQIPSSQDIRYQVDNTSGFTSLGAAAVMVSSRCHDSAPSSSYDSGSSCDSGGGGGGGGGD